MNLDNNIIDVVEDGIENYFPVGQKLSVVRIFADDPENYPSYVKDLDDEYIFIDLLSKGGTPIALHQDSEIDVAVITQDGIWIGESFIVEIINSHISGAWITYPETLEKIQRREYIRWDYSFPVEAIVTSKDQDKDEIQARCVNLSGGGIAIMAKEPMSKFNEVKLEFEIGNMKINSRAKFIHTEYDHKLKKYISGMKFLEVPRFTSDKIHKLVIQKQLEERRKGLV